jgi:hypothetical protein
VGQNLENIFVLLGQAKIPYRQKKKKRVINFISSKLKTVERCDSSSRAPVCKCKALSSNPSHSKKKVNFCSLKDIIKIMKGKYMTERKYLQITYLKQFLSILFKDLLKYNN